MVLPTQQVSVKFSIALGKGNLIDSGNFVHVSRTRPHTACWTVALWSYKWPSTFLSVLLLQLQHVAAVVVHASL